MNSIKLEKVRIHSQIGGVPELFYESKGNIHELVRGHNHYAFIKIRNYLLDLIIRVILIGNV